MILDIFSYAYLSSIYPLWWSICSSLLPIFWLSLFVLLLSFENPLSILDMNHLSAMWFENIFFLSVACLFILSIVFFTEQMKSYLPIFFSKDLALGSWAKNFAQPMSQIVSPKISSERFWVLHFILIQLFLFSLQCKVGFQVCPLSLDVPLSWNNLLKRLSFLLKSFGPFSKINLLYLCRSISVLSILFHWYIVQSFANIALFDYCSFMTRL